MLTFLWDVYALVYMFVQCPGFLECPEGDTEECPTGDIAIHI